MKLSKKQVGLIAIGCVLAFILINSMMNSNSSMKLAIKFKQFLYTVLGDHGGWWRDFIFYNLRKIAHFIEYFILGFLLSKIYFNKNKNCRRLINLIFIALIVSILDESIQIFTERHSKISDIWLDLIGSVCGVLLYLVYEYLKILIKRVIRKND